MQYRDLGADGSGIARIDRRSGIPYNETVTSVLDSPDIVARMDPEGLLGRISGLPEQMEQAWAAATALGAMFLWQAYRLWRRGASEEASTAGAIALYRYSITYLSLLFLAVAVDALVLIPV